LVEVSSILIDIVKTHALRSESNPTLCAGQCAWGFRVASDGQITRDEREERVAAVARHMHANGRTLREIVDLLRECGVVSRRGTPLGMTRVFEIIHGGRTKRPNGE
jgi:hypothetical protein